jgi:hypothetical protein
LGVTYFNQGERVNFGIQAFQSSLLYTVGYDFNSVAYLRDTYRGFNAIAVSVQSLYASRFPAGSRGRR